MKNSVIASVMIALSLAASGNAFAQRDDHGRGQDHGRYEKHDDRHDNGPKHDKNDKRDKYDARHYHRDDKRGGGPRGDLRRGGYLSKEYRTQRYVVTDWRARHLSAPPKGHHWVRAGNDYVLAAIATGVIAQVLLSN